MSIKSTSSITLSPELKEEMRNFAFDCRMTFSALVRVALIEFKANNKGKK